MGMATRHVGNCQICERDQKLHGGLLVHHGYTRPGDGYTHGSCPGVNQPPYEVSCEALKSYRVGLERALSAAQARLAEIRGGRVDRFTRMHRKALSKRHELVEYIRGQTDEITFNYELRLVEGEVASKVHVLEGEIKRVTARIDRWAPKEVRTFEEEQRKADAGRAERKAAKDAARAEREAKKVATAAKQEALKVSRLAIQRGFEARARELAAQPASPERQAAARELFAEMKKKKYDWMAWWELESDAFVAIGLATVEGRNPNGRPYVRWSYHHMPAAKGLRRRYARRGHAVNRSKVSADVVGAMADALGGQGWDAPQLVSIIEKQIDWSKPVSVHKAADALLEEGFDPRHLL